MKAVQDEIAAQRKELAQHEFLRALEGNGDIEAIRRMVPRLAFYVLAFQDVLRLVYERCTDPKLRALAHTHYAEDRGHDLWYLHDAQVLGVPVDVRWLFSVDHERARDVSYDLVALAISADHDAGRFAVAMALEGVGAEFFFRIIGQLERLGHAAGLRYFARHHQEVEASHELFEADTRRDLDDLELDAETTHAACDVVKKTFTIMTALADDLAAALQEQTPPALSLRGFPEAARVNVDVSEAARLEASRDFGQLERGSPLAVVCPASTGDVERIVIAAGNSGLQLVARGRGWSQSGQSIARDGVTVVLSGLKAPLEVRPRERRVRVGAGALWREVLSATLSFGLAPPVLPLNLDLTIGGVLSAGGFGSNSHTLGLVASHVTALTAVLGDGSRASCGPEVDREVFDALLGGAGRAGIITEVELALRAAPETIRTTMLRYHDFGRALEDYGRLARLGDVAHLELFCTATTIGLRPGPSGARVPTQTWSFTMLVAWESAAANTDEPPFLQDLQPDKRVGTDVESFAEHAARYDSRFEGIRRLGAWSQPHPWLEVMLPPDAGPGIGSLLESLPPFLGDGHRILWLSPAGRPRSVAFPRGERALGFAIMPPLIARPFLSQALEVLRTIDREARAQGGKRYVSGWLPDWSTARWREHFGEDFDAIASSVRRCDPRGLFRSLLPPLEARLPSS